MLHHTEVFWDDRAAVCTLALFDVVGGLHVRLPDGSKFGKYCQK